MDNNFYTTKDVLKKVGVTRPTLYKWLKEGKIPEVSRDRNDFRLFTKKDIDNILAYKNLIKKPTIKNSNMNSNNGTQQEAEHV
jgi:excisionase family DNA binding protein